MGAAHILSSICPIQKASRLPVGTTVIGRMHCYTKEIIWQKHLFWYFDVKFINYNKQFRHLITNHLIKSEKCNCKINVANRRQFPNNWQKFLTTPQFFVGGAAFDLNML